MYDFLNDLRNFDDALFALHNNNWLLNYAVNNDILDLNMILNLFGSDNVSFFDYFLDNSLNFDYFRHPNDLLNYLLNHNWYLHDLLNHFFNWHHLLLNNLYFSELS